MRIPDPDRDRYDPEVAHYLERAINETKHGGDPVRAQALASIAIAIILVKIERAFS